MTLRIVADTVNGIRKSVAPGTPPAWLSGTLSASINFKSILSVTDRLSEPSASVKTNQKLLRDAQMAQSSMSELMAIRCQVRELRTLFTDLDIQSHSFNASVAKIRTILSQPPTQKVISLFNAEDSILFKKVWAELGMGDPSDPAMPDKALTILDKLDEKIGGMLQHNEKMLLDILIARENTAALCPEKEAVHAVRRGL